MKKFYTEIIQRHPYCWYATSKDGKHKVEIRQYGEKYMVRIRFNENGFHGLQPLDSSYEFNGIKNSKQEAFAELARWVKNE